MFYQINASRALQDEIISNLANEILFKVCKTDIDSLKPHFFKDHYKVRSSKLQRNIKQL